jgi:hypothetical protein
MNLRYFGYVVCFEQFGSGLEYDQILFINRTLPKC